MNILEIGASSLLDFDTNEGRRPAQKQFRWTKIYRHNKPVVYDTLLQRMYLESDVQLRNLLFDKDAIIFSVGNKGPRELFHEYDPNDAIDMITTNFTSQAELVSRILPRIMYNNKKVKLIYLGSVSGAASEDAVYPNHALYAAMKAAMRSLWQTLKVEYSPYPNLEFIYMELPQIQSRMSEGGESPERFRKELISILDK